MQLRKRRRVRGGGKRRGVKKKASIIKSGKTLSPKHVPRGNRKMRI